MKGWLALIVTLFVVPVSAQSDTDAAALVAESVSVVTSTDVYGRELRSVRGSLRNTGDTAFTDVTLSAQAADREGELVAEGFGYLVNACGAALLPGYIIAPGAALAFDVPLELLTPDAQIADVSVSIQGTPTTAEAAPAVLPEGVTQLDSGEVVQVEWLDDSRVRYGVGCDNRLFSELAWREANIARGTTRPVTHPLETLLDDEDLLRRLTLDTPDILAASHLTLAPDESRLVYQAEFNRVLTAEQDGSFIRISNQDMYNRTLQGIYWFAPDSFLAYYFGAYGDPVLYFTATAASQPLSLSPINGLPSEIVPGVSPNGTLAIIGGTFFEETGYYLKALGSNNDPRLVLSADLPGNNFPPPLFLVAPPDAPDAGRQTVVLPRLIDGAAQAQCLDVESGTLTDLVALPLALATDERAWWWLSPDDTSIILAANGVNGGLWHIDFAALGACRL